MLGTDHQYSNTLCRREKAHGEGEEVIEMTIGMMALFAQEHEFRARGGDFGHAEQQAHNSKGDCLGGVGVGLDTELRCWTKDVVGKTKVQFMWTVRDCEAVRPCRRRL